MRRLARSGVPVEPGAASRPGPVACPEVGGGRLARQGSACAGARRTLQPRTRLSPGLPRRPVAGHGAALEGATERIGRRPAALRILLEAAGHREVEVLRARRLRSVLIGVGHLGDLLHQDAGNGRCIEGQLTGQHLIGHDAEAVEVAATVDLLLARGLLRAHVLRCADRHAGAGQGGARSHPTSPWRCRSR